MAVVTTTYLEIQDRQDFRPKYNADPALMIQETVVPLVPFYRFLYETVGREWQWTDRLAWSDAELYAWLAKPSTAVFVLYVSGTPAGYIELDQQGESTEIAYFGLIRQFFRRGYGKHLLSYGIRQGFDRGAKRVWVHTCTLDGPYALQTYQQVGFQIYDQVDD